jgi:sepiapterin reductase
MRNLFIVSGASQGFGSCLTLELAKCVKLNDGDALYVLLQRSQVNTREIQTEFQSANTPFKAEFISLSIDFESKSVEEKLLDLFARLGNEEFKKSFLFNNAGTIGTLQNIQDYSYQSIFQCIHTNLVSTMLLTSVFLRRYPISTIVNISSLAAIEAFETWGCYSATKAGLDIFHRTICKENPKVRVLNYAPGPLDTDMQKVIDFSRRKYEKPCQMAI